MSQVPALQRLKKDDQGPWAVWQVRSYQKTENSITWYILSSKQSEFPFNSRVVNDKLLIALWKTQFGNMHIQQSGQHLHNKIFSGSINENSQLIFYKTKFINIQKILTHCARFSKWMDIPRQNSHMCTRLSQSPERGSWGWAPSSRLA